MELTEIDTCRGLLGACQPLALPGLTLLWGQAVLRAPRTLYPILSHPQGHGRMALECSRGPPSLGPVSGSQAKSNETHPHLWVISRSWKKLPGRKHGRLGPEGGGMEGILNASSGRQSSCEGQSRQVAR